MYALRIPGKYWFTMSGRKEESENMAPFLTPLLQLGSSRPQSSQVQQKLADYAKNRQEVLQTKLHDQLPVLYTLLIYILNTRLANG